MRIKKDSIFFRAMALTGANLALRMVTMGFQVYLSGQIGAAGVGLLQLIQSVASLALTAGLGGIRTTTMYLTAQELGQQRPQATGTVLRVCFRYAMLFGTAAAAVVVLFSRQIAGQWIGDLQSLPALRTLGVLMPISCLCGVITGYYTAASKIRQLVTVEFLEQAASMILTLGLLLFWSDGSPAQSCQAVIAGSSLAALVTLWSLLLTDRQIRQQPKEKIPVARRMLAIALPLALADDLRMGLSTIESLITPKRLALYPMTQNALADFGTISGMTFPVMMFPACILYALAELLIPELSRCAAGGNQERINGLCKKGLQGALVYGLVCAGGLFLLSDRLGQGLYQSDAVGKYLKWFAPLVPMLYCDLITDAAVKGLGQQVKSVRNNIITSAMDVGMLWILLPKMGLAGYYLSFTVSHAVNFMLSISILRNLTDLTIPWRKVIPAAALCVGAVLAASFPASVTLQLTVFLALLAAGLWMLGLLKTANPPQNATDCGG